MSKKGKRNYGGEIKREKRRKIVLHTICWWDVKERAVGWWEGKLGHWFQVIVIGEDMSVAYCMT